MSRIRECVAIFQAGHPASLRCSSLKCRPYSRSSRLAIRASHPENLATHFESGTLEAFGQDPIFKHAQIDQPGSRRGEESRRPA